MGSMDEQSLFDSYDNQKVPSGKPPKLSDEPWKKRPLDPDFDDFHIPPKRTALFEEAKPDIHENVDDKRVIVPAGKRRPPVTPDGMISFILLFFLSVFPINPPITESSSPALHFRVCSAFFYRYMVYEEYNLSRGLIGVSVH